MMVKKLKEAGADESALNNDGLTPEEVTAQRKKNLADAKASVAAEKKNRLAAKAADKQEEMESSEVTAFLRENGLEKYAQAMYDRNFRDLEHIEDCCRGRARENDKDLKKGGISDAADRDRVVELINQVWQQREIDEQRRLEEEERAAQQSMTMTRIITLLFIVGFFVGIYFLLHYVIGIREQNAGMPRRPARPSIHDDEF